MTTKIRQSWEDDDGPAHEDINRLCDVVDLLVEGLNDILFTEDGHKVIGISSRAAAKAFNKHLHICKITKKKAKELLDDR